MRICDCQFLFLAATSASSDARDVLHANKRQIPTLGLSSHRLSSSYLRTRIRVIFLREREDIHVRDFVIDDGFHLLGNFSYLRTRKGVKGYLREDNCSVGVAETLSLVGVQHIGPQCPASPLVPISTSTGEPRRPKIAFERSDAV